MKTKLFAICFLLTTAAFGQSVLTGSPMNPDAQPVPFFSHPQHARQTPMASEESPMEKSGVLYAQGTRPLWEVAPEANPVPLGDAARVLRKEHESAKKAVIVWNN